LSVPSWTTLARQAAPGSDDAPWRCQGWSQIPACSSDWHGAIWLKKGGWFNARGPAWQLIVRFLIGIAGVFVLWMGLGAVFPRGETLLPLLLRYARYTLVGLWVAGIAPLLFIRLGVAKKAG
jgi:hypothetical protein